MTSSRLPGKILAPVLGRPLLAYQVERLRRVAGQDVIAIATTTNPADDPVARQAEDLGCVVWRGPEHDVLERFAGCARALDAEVIVRSTADQPLLDPTVFSRLIDRFGRERPDYAATYVWRPTWPEGLDSEVFSRAALERAAREASDPVEREHVTVHFKRHPETFVLLEMPSPIELQHHRWTVDTPADLELVTRILECLYPRHPAFSLEDVLELLREHPEWEAADRSAGSSRIFAPPGTSA
jgi:spore coat polysaccharide biosynthesis protein SpsF